MSLPAFRLAFLCVPLVLASACGVVENVQESPVLQAAGIVPDQPCTVTAIEGRRLAGIYLRRAKAAPSYDLLFLTGALRDTGLPRSIRIDDSRVRNIDRQEDGTLTGRLGIPLISPREAVASPDARFTSDGMPAVYELDYTANDIDYTGALVIGPSPTGFEIPTVGQTGYSGRILLDLETIDDSGAVTRSELVGRFTLDAMHGGGQARLSVGQIAVLSGPAPEFTGLTWTGLGLCGARVVSSGFGSVRFLMADGRPALPFFDPADPPALQAQHDSVQFAAPERPDQPAQIGGAFLIGSGSGTLTGRFLSD